MKKESTCPICGNKTIISHIYDDYGGEIVANNNNVAKYTMDDQIVVKCANGHKYYIKDFTI